MPKTQESKAEKSRSAEQIAEEAKSDNPMEGRKEPKKRPKVPVIIVPATEEATHERIRGTSPIKPRSSTRSRSTGAEPRGIGNTDSGAEIVKNLRPRSSSDSKLGPERGEAATSSPRLPVSSFRDRIRRSSCLIKRNDQVSSENRVDADRPKEKRQPIDSLPEAQSSGYSTCSEDILGGKLLLGNARINDLQEENHE